MIKAFVLAAACAAIGCVIGCVKEPGRCLLNECPQNGKVVYRYNNGIVYDGDVLNGVAWGKGKSIDPTGSTYEGDFVAGSMHGDGVLSVPGGMTYKGKFSGNTVNGFGEMIIPGNTKINLGEKHLYLPIGVTMRGEWLKGDMRNGRIEWMDGRIYAGDMKDFKRSGQGTTTYADGRKVCGQWDDTAAVVLLTPAQFNAIKPSGPCGK